MGTNKKKFNKNLREDKIKFKQNLANETEILQNVNFPNLESDTARFKNHKGWNKQHTDYFSRYSETQSYELPKKQMKTDDIFTINTSSKPYTPVIVEAKKNMEEKHQYVFPSLPITTTYMPRCTTAIQENHFGHFETKRFKEYRQLKNIFLSHKLNKYKYVVDPIIYLNDDIIKAECDEGYHKLFNYIRYRKKE